LISLQQALKTKIIKKKTKQQPNATELKMIQTKTKYQLFVLHTQNEMKT